MIVSENSPTRRMPVTLDPRSILYLDGIRYSTQLVDLAYSRLEGTLEKLVHKDDQQGAVGNLIVEAISDAWAFVDSLHRRGAALNQTHATVQPQHGAPQEQPGHGPPERALCGLDFQRSSATTPGCIENRDQPTPVTRAAPAASRAPAQYHPRADRPQG